MDNINTSTFLQALLNDQNNSLEIIDTLLSSPASAKLSPELLAQFEELKETMNRKKILEQYEIKQLPDGRWWIRFPDGTLVRKSDKKKLEDVIIKYHTEQPNINSINHFYDSYMIDRKQQVADTTWFKDVQNYKKFIQPSALAAKDISEITRADCREFFNFCKSIKPDMKRRYWDTITVTLNSMFDYAIELGYIATNPLRGMKIHRDQFAAAKVTKDEDAIFSREEQRDICYLAERDAIETGSAIPLAIILLFNLGIRDGELVALCWKDVEGDYLHIQREITEHVNEKTEQKEGYSVKDHCKTISGDRKLFLNSECKRILNLMRELNQANGYGISDDDFILQRTLPKTKIVTYCNGRCIDARLRKYCRQAGFAVEKSPHDIRRTVFTNLYLMGMHLREIQKFAGHSDIKMTLHYIKSIPSTESLDIIENLSSKSNIIPFSAPNSHEFQNGTNGTKNVL